MQHRRFIRFVTSTVFLAAIIILVMLVGIWGSNHIPLWISGPVLIFLLVAMCWRETRP